MNDPNLATKLELHLRTRRNLNALLTSHVWRLSRASTRLRDHLILCMFLNSLILDICWLLLIKQTGHQPDPKCRFFWKMGEIPPYETKYPGLNAPNVIPEDADLKARWEPTLKKWGNSMKNAWVCFVRYLLITEYRILWNIFSVKGIAEMAALGLNLEREAFIEASRYGLVTLWLLYMY